MHLIHSLRTRLRPAVRPSVLLLVLLALPSGCKKKSNTFPTGVGMTVNSIVGNPLPVDVKGDVGYSATFAEVHATLYTTAGDISLIPTDSTVIDTATFYFVVTSDSSGLLCPGASTTTPCSNVLPATVPVYNASVSYAGGGTGFVQVVPASLKAAFLYRLALNNDSVSGTLFLQLRGHNQRGETVVSSWGSTPFLMRDFPG
jgi:hypothetical protein